ncbi:hypothetical protein BDW62DRAFT_188583 [Aspergillus aurantiobrunneus]
MTLYSKFSLAICLFSPGLPDPLGAPELMPSEILGSICYLGASSCVAMLPSSFLPFSSNLQYCTARSLYKSSSCCLPISPSRTVAYQSDR